MEILWDLDDDPEGNVWHIEEHGLSKEEVESVVSNPMNPTGDSRRTQSPATFGWTFTGRHIIVIWEHVEEDPLRIRPITAYEVPPREEK